MEITKEWLEEEQACLDGLNWFLNQSETDLYRIIDKLIEEQHENWANWLITRAMGRQQQLQYAIACAELVLPIFEEELPQDNRPRAAIEAAKKVLLQDSKKNRDAANAAVYAAYAAVWDAADVSAANAANAARSASFAADAAYTAAADAARLAARAALNWKLILEIGINILKGKLKGENNLQYTIKEQIEILEGKILDEKARIRRAFSEEQKAKARIELKRTEEKINILKGKK